MRSSPLNTVAAVPLRSSRCYERLPRLLYFGPKPAAVRVFFSRFCAFFVFLVGYARVRSGDAIPFGITWCRAQKQCTARQKIGLSCWIERKCCWILNLQTRGTLKDGHFDARRNERRRRARVRSAQVILSSDRCGRTTCFGGDSAVEITLAADSIYQPCVSSDIYS